MEIATSLNRLALITPAVIFHLKTYEIKPDVISSLILSILTNCANIGFKTALNLFKKYVLFIMPESQNLDQKLTSEIELTSRILLVYFPVETF